MADTNYNVITNLIVKMVGAEKFKHLNQQPKLIIAKKIYVAESFSQLQLEFFSHLFLLSP